MRDNLAYHLRIQRYKLNRAPLVQRIKESHECSALLNPNFTLLDSENCRAELTMKCFLLGSLTCILLSNIGITEATEMIDRDVVIIGGGAAGVYAATLLQSLGRTIAVIENNPRFGGHTETYTVPGTNKPVDYGVEGYSPLVNGSYDVIEQFFGAYSVPIKFIHRSETSSKSTRYFDFHTAIELVNFTVNTNLATYIAQVDKYPYLDYQIQTPSPIPGDFILSFGDFVKKHSLQSSVYNIYYNVEGLGDILSLPAYYVLRELNAAHLLSLAPASPGLIISANNFNQEPYLRAQARFSADALVSSTVQSAERGPSGVTLEVQTPSGQLTIRATKLLVTMPPTMANMKPLGLDSSESELFNKFSWSGWYAALVNITGLMAGEGFQNARRDNQYNLPKLPALYQISPTQVDGIYLVRYGSTDSMSTDDVKADIVSTIERIRAAAVPSAGTLPPVKLLTFANHLPYNLHVTGSDLEAGFNNKLAGLQGHRSTWYSGATFTGSSSTDIWNATQIIVSSMLTS